MSLTEHKKEEKVIHPQNDISMIIIWWQTFTSKCCFFLLSNVVHNDLCKPAAHSDFKESLFFLLFTQRQAIYVKKNARNKIH